MELNFDSAVTLKWLNELCVEADSQAKLGNMAMVNTISNRSSAFAHYYINVHKLHTITEAQFVLQYNGPLREMERMRQETVTLEEAAANNVRITTLETQLQDLGTKLDTILQSLAESRQPAAPVEVEKPKAKSGKKPAKSEPAEETEVVTESEDAESEA